MLLAKQDTELTTNSQWEESGESQFLGSLWRATLLLSRKHGCQSGGSLDRVYEALAAPGGIKVIEPSDGDGAGVRVFQGVTTRTDPSRTERLHPGKAQ